MKKFSAKYFLALTFGFLMFVATAEDKSIHLGGKVIDSHTGEILPFAHVIVSNVGTTTNLDGEFYISFEKNEKGQELKVSFMGYESVLLNIAQSRLGITIELKPKSTELKEVMVYSADHVVKDVSNYKHVNYEYEDQQLTSYYKEILKSSSDYFYLAEGVLDIYLPTIYSDNKPIVHPLKSRKKVFVSADSAEITFVKGNAVDMLNSITRRKDSFIERTQIDNYSFVKEGLVVYDNREVFKISFEPKNRKAIARGTLYVDVESHAVIKVEYHPLIEKQSFWTNVKWIEEYIENNGTWYLSRVSYLGEWLENGDNMSFESLLVVTNFEKAVEKPSYETELTSKDVFLNYVSDFSESFWDGLNHIKLSINEVESVSSSFSQSLE